MCGSRPAGFGGVADALTDEQERNGLVGHHRGEAHPLVRRRDDAVVLHRRLDRRQVLGLGLLHQLGVRPHPLDGWSGQAKESRRRSRIATHVCARLRVPRPVRARGAALQWSCNKKRRGCDARQKSTPAALLRLRRAVQRGRRGQRGQARHAKDGKASGAQHPFSTCVAGTWMDGARCVLLVGSASFSELSRLTIFNGSTVCGRTGVLIGARDAKLAITSTTRLVSSFFFGRNVH